MSETLVNFINNPKISERFHRNGNKLHVESMSFALVWMQIYFCTSDDFFKKTFWRSNCYFFLHKNLCLVSDFRTLTIHLVKLIPTERYDQYWNHNTKYQIRSSTILLISKSKNEWCQKIWKAISGLKMHCSIKVVIFPISTLFPYDPVFINFDFGCMWAHNNELG